MFPDWSSAQAEDIMQRTRSDDRFRVLALGPTIIDQHLGSILKDDTVAHRHVNLVMAISISLENVTLPIGLQSIRVR